jgi:hypothetical protein
MPPKKKARALGAQPTAAETKAARRAESEKCILALERKAKDEASKAAAAAAAAAETEQQLQDLRDAQTGDTSSEEETERPTGGSSSQRSLNNELAQRLEAQAEEIKELKEIVYSRRTHDVAGRREASRREASRRGSSGHPLSVMSPSPASKRARGTAPERSGRAHSEQEETFSDDGDSLTDRVRGDISARANRLRLGEEGSLASLNGDPHLGEYESEEESDGESIAGSDVDDAEGGDGSLAKHAMKSVVLEKKLIHDQECRDLSATPYRHWAGKQAAMAALKRQYSLTRTIAVTWRVLTSIKKAFPSAVSVETATDDAGYKIRNHPAFLAATSELQYLRMQKLLAEGDRTAITVTDVCDDPQAAMNYINQQWSLKKNKPSEYLNTIIAASKSAAFVKFLKEKPASSSRQQSRKSQREERFHSDGEDDEDDKHAGAMVVFQGGKQSRNHKGNKAKSAKYKGKGGKGGGGGGAATKP